MGILNIDLNSISLELNLKNVKHLKNNNWRINANSMAS